MMLFAKGHRFYDKYDNYICKTARDLYMLEPVSVEDFTDWQIPVPAPGDIIHPVIMMEINEKIKYLLPVQDKVKYSFVKMIYKLLGWG